ncbi:metallophosphoesterase, partial [Acinetobacter baumannii]|uniref:metallophosphoesterase n=1 Tax=Acinetobacter baumannii TaxID=470 RepID=UPI0014903025
TIAGIGDIHGLVGHLEPLIDAARSAGVDKIVFTGDYIDRGPYGLRVIDQIIALQKCSTSPTIEALMGNHEQILLNILFN